MHDLALRLENRPGALAEMGEALGRAGVNNEQAARETLQHDPWETAGLLTTERIRPWTVLLDSRKK